MSVAAAESFHPSTVGALEALAERAREVDGVTPFSDDLWKSVEADSTSLALTITHTGGALAGAAFVAQQGERHTAELVVDPAHRRQGHGSRLVRELFDSTSGELWLWAHGDHPGAAALAARHHLERGRELLQLRRGVGSGAADLPEVRLPDGVRLRTFVAGQDESAWLAVNNAAFHWHPEQGGQTPDDIRAAEADPDFDPAGFFLAVDDAGEILGFHWTKVHPADPNPPGGTAAGPIGEVYVLGVAPSAHGTGLGSALTAAGLRHLAEKGLDTVQLYVEGDNPAALRLYERAGFTRYAVDVAYRHPVRP